MSFVEVHMMTVYCGPLSLPFDFDEIGSPRTLFRETQEQPAMSTAMLGVLVYAISVGASEGSEMADTGRPAFVHVKRG